MRKSNRIRSKLPDNLPAPSTTRPLPPRSRAVSLVRSGLQSDGSRGSSPSNSSRRSSAMGESMLDVDMLGTGVIVSGLEPVATSSNSSLNMDRDDEAGGSSSTVMKRKRSDSVIVFQDGNDATTLDHSDLLRFPPSSGSSLKGKGKAKEFHLNSPDILDTPQETSHQKGKNKALEVDPKPKKPKEELLGGYSCPICFSPPSNATLTPCGHICCGLCLFMAVKTTMQRANMMMAPEGAIPRCPVCRATIPGWDGKGGGVIGLKARAILTL